MPPRDTRRPDRVAEAIREEVATFLAGGVKDPRVVGLVTVTGVEMTRDLGHATVFVSVYGSDEERADDDGRPRQRRRTRCAAAWAGRCKLRIAPHITFKQDDSVARAARIESLLASVKPKPEEPADDGR